VLKKEMELIKPKRIFLLTQPIADFEGFKV
jgi:hypothetical protein